MVFCAVDGGVGVPAGTWWGREPWPCGVATGICGRGTGEGTPYVVRFGGCGVPAGFGTRGCGGLVTGEPSGGVRVGTPYCVR